MRWAVPPTKYFVLRNEERSSEDLTCRWARGPANFGVTLGSLLAYEGDCGSFWGHVGVTLGSFGVTLRTLGSLLGTLNI